MQEHWDTLFPWYCELKQEAPPDPFPESVLDHTAFTVSVEKEALFRERAQHYFSTLENKTLGDHLS